MAFVSRAAGVALPNESRRPPPERYVIEDFPDFSAGVTLHTALEDRNFSVVGADAWNPSITGGPKSEHIVLVGAEGFEVVTRTALPELDLTGLARPAVVGV